MKLVSIDAPPHGKTGALIGDDVLDFAAASTRIPMAAWIPTDMRELLVAGQPALDLVGGIVDRVRNASEAERTALRAAQALRPRAGVRLLAPIPRPNMVLSHGRAYASHRGEMRRGEVAPTGDTPVAFIKNTGSIIGTDDPIILPPQCPDMVDFEAEFSVVFGKSCCNVTEAEAMDYIMGYTIVNDVSARDWVLVSRKSEWPGDRDMNRMGKQLPTFCPIGPVIVTKDEIPDPHNVSVSSTLNGQPMQSAHTSDLIFTVPALIAFFSRWYPFEPGDVLTTGSPPGVGFGRTPQIFLKPGDVVDITVEGIGTLSNVVRAAGG
jgi:2-keto-4-pentenoate hydratase/2-oxohepta-3-ene-1,7-dioic acid hydratase in catechol pathway